MAELLKDMLNRESMLEFALAIRGAYGAFRVDDFLSATMDESWDGLELMARGRHISRCLKVFLPADYREAISVIDKVMPLDVGFAKFSFMDYVEVNGQGEADWDVTMDAFERYTVYASAEFAVRPFIIKHEERMMAQMYACCH